MEFRETIQPIRLAAPRAGGEVFTKLMKIPGVQMIYVSVLACTRHRNIDFIEMQRKGRLSYLLLSEVDMITGDYIQKTKDAAAEIAAERDPSGIILLTGCQSALLSTDYTLLAEEIQQETGVPIRVHDGCRLCGFDEEKGGSGSIDRLLYSFLLPAEKSAEKSVNILGGARPDESSELFAILEQAGVARVNSLSRCKDFNAYLDMSKAHLNILTSPQDEAIGRHLQETLGIPYICLGGVYDSARLDAAYAKLAQALDIEIDTGAYSAPLADKLDALKPAAGGRSITVDGDAELARWLLEEGFPVQSLTLNPHQGLTGEQSAWFEKNAPHFRVESFHRGGHGGGKPGGHGGKPGGRPGGGKPDGRPGGHGRPGGASALKLGYAGSMAALDNLERALGGAAR